MPTTMRAIGHTIKTLRIRRGMTLEQLAEKSGCTPGFISQLERYQAAPSIVTLDAIAEVLGVKITDLLPDITNPTKVARKNERSKFKIEGSAVEYSLLSTKFPHRALQVFILTFAPPDESLPTDECRAHLGEEFVYVLDGELHVSIGENAYDLSAGDSIYFNSGIKHRLENRTSRPVTVISMITPSIF